MHAQSLAPVEPRKTTTIRSLPILIPLTLLIALALTLGLKLSAPGMVLSIQPLPASNAQGSNIWVMNISSGRAPVTDWSKLTLGQGWVKGADQSLPSGAAALTADPSAAALVYLVPDNTVDVVLATGPDFGAVRLSVGGTTREINLASPERKLVSEQIARPLLSISSWQRSELALVVLCVLALWGVLLGGLLAATRLRLLALLAASALLFFTWAVYVPIYEGPDEVHHWEYARFLHDNRRLPRISPELAEANSPPLYYALIAPLARETATPPPLPVEQRTNFAIYQHEPGETSRYAPLLAARLLTALISFGVVVAAYFIAYEVSGSAQVGLLAAAIAGLLPQHTFRGMNISNDSLVALCAAWSIYGIVRLIKRGFSWRLGILTGVCVAGAYLSKINAVYLPVLLALALVIPHGTLGERLRRLTVMLVPLVLVLPWLLFNIFAYGDPFARAAMREAVQHIVVIKPITSPFFYTIFPELLSKSFIGVFGWMNIFLPSWMYLLYGLLAGAAAAGGVALLLSGAARSRWMVAVLWMALCAVIILTAYINLSFDQPQGRYLFPALGAIAALWAVGLGRWFGERQPLYAAVMVGIALSNLFALLRLIYPIYYR